MGIANCYAQYRDEYTWLKMQLAIPLETRVREAGISYAEEAKKTPPSQEESRVLIVLGFHMTIPSW